MGNKKNLNDNKDIIQSSQQSLIVRTSSLAKRGLDLISRLGPRILYVPSDYKSIEEALKAAVDGDIIEIFPGEYKILLIIDKSITIRGASEGIKIQHKENPHIEHGIKKDFPTFANDISPIIKINCFNKNVVIQNIDFLGIDAANFPLAIDIEEGNAIIKNCNFINFEIGFDTWSLLYDNNLEDMDELYVRATINITGENSRMELDDCNSENCAVFIEANNRSILEIRNNKFSGDNCLIIYDEVQAHLANNIFSDGTFSVGNNSILISNYDTYCEVGELLSSISNSKIIFNHASIKAYHLLGIAIGKSLVEVDNYGNLLWTNIPKITFSDCIIIIKSNEIVSRYAASAFQYNIPIPRKTNIFEFNIVNFEKNNLINIPPNYYCEDPQFGPIDKNSISLLPNSPAIKAASDGSNLGAWQKEQL